MYDKNVESVLLEQFESLYLNMMNEKTSKKDNKKLEQLINDIIALNVDSNADVKAAIAILKKELKESPELMALVIKNMDSNPKNLIERLRKIGESEVVKLSEMFEIINNKTK